MIKKLPTAIGALMYAAIAAAGPTDQASGGAMLGFSAAHSPMSRPPSGSSMPT
jgi:hypothetical protein